MFTSLVVWAHECEIISPYSSHIRTCTFLSANQHKREQKTAHTNTSLAMEIRFRPVVQSSFPLSRSPETSTHGSLNLTMAVCLTLRHNVKKKPRCWPNRFSRTDSLFFGCTWTGPFEEEHTHTRIKTLIMQFRICCRHIASSSHDSCAKFMMIVLLCTLARSSKCLCFWWCPNKWKYFMIINFWLQIQLNSRGECKQLPSVRFWPCV